MDSQSEFLETNHANWENMAGTSFFMFWFRFISFLRSQQPFLCRLPFVCLFVFFFARLAVHCFAVCFEASCLTYSVSVFLTVQTN